MLCVWVCVWLCSWLCMWHVTVNWFRNCCCCPPLMKASTSIWNCLPGSHRIKHVATFVFSEFPTFSAFIHRPFFNLCVMILFLYRNVHTYVYNYSFDILFVHCVVEMCQRVFPMESECTQGRGAKAKRALHAVHTMQILKSFNKQSTRCQAKICRVVKRAEAVRIYCFASMLFRFHYR